MTNTSELDERLRDFIENPEDFISSMAFTNALHQYPVWASKDVYAIEIDDLKVTPVFTDLSDLEHFKEEQKSAVKYEWIERSSIKVLEEVIVNGLSGLVYNPKKEGDFDNSTLFKSNELTQFINHFTTLLNRVLNDDNLQTEILEKFYFVPVFIHQKENGKFDRLFPTMSTAEKKSYVPVFSNPQSLAKWYYHEEFGKPFQQAQGVIVAWKVTDIYQLETGDSNVDDTVGLVVNPFDDEQVLISWTDIDED